MELAVKIVKQKENPNIFSDYLQTLQFSSEYLFKPVYLLGEKYHSDPAICLTNSA